MPMTIYTINHDGTGKQRVTTDEGTNWAPYPAPDGKHFAYVKMLPPFNFEIFIRNLETGEEIQLTDYEGFDGFPAISPDGKLLTFSSGRQAPEGQRTLHQYVMDVSSLALGPE
jgi:Tol biopolymer transport system component